MRPKRQKAKNGRAGCAALCAVAAVLCLGAPLRGRAADYSQNFDAWSGAEAWGAYTNTDNWVIHDGRVGFSSNAPSPPNAGWLQNITVSTNSWLRSPLLSRGVGTLSLSCRNIAGLYNAFDVQWSRDGATWTTALTLVNSNTAWTACSRLLDLRGPLYLRLLKTDDDRGIRVDHWLGFDDIVATLPQSVQYTNLFLRQLAPSSRTTPLIISEIMYHPAAKFDGRSLEYVELFNTEPVAQELGRCRVAGAADFIFPPDAVLPARSFVVVARDPDAVREYYGITNVVGPLSTNLPNDTGVVRLRDAEDAILLEVEYSDRGPWPAAADGAGCSLVLALPDYGEALSKSWASSDAAGGSPGTYDPTNAYALDAVVINEIVAHTDPPEEDWIELYNAGTQTVDISGCRLQPRESEGAFTVPAGTLMAPRSYRRFTQSALGFLLQNQGDSVYLFSPGGFRVLDSVRFEAQENVALSRTSWGRHPDGAPGWQELSPDTPGASNTARRIRDVVINEIMYHPISGLVDDEYVELHNRGGQPVNLGGWRFTAGIDYEFREGTVIPAGGYLVVAANATNLLARYPQLNAANTFGNYEGQLSDRGERLVLSKPDDPAAPEPEYVAVDEVAYDDGDYWGKWTDGGGSSLELTDAHADNALAGNWAGSDETGKSTGLWTTIEYTGRLDYGDGGMLELDLYLLHAGECLVDNVELRTQGGPVNFYDDFQSGIGNWIFNQGNHFRSSWATNAGYQSSASLHVRASGRGNTGWSRAVYPSYNQLAAPLASPPFAGDTVTLSARVRWLCGWPQIVLSLQGWWLEAAGPMALPVNLGSPGLPNSRATANAGPALSEVTHGPLVPAAGQDVTVTCRAHDPDGVGAVTLRHRVDPRLGYSASSMRDDGLGPDRLAGDGVYTGSITGQPIATVVGFYVEAADARPTPAVSRFPSDAPARECLVQFMALPAPKDIARYALWMTSSNLNELATRSVQSDELLDGTLVYGDWRALYNAGVRYRGYKRLASKPLSYAVELSKSDRLLGSDELKLTNTGQHGEDLTRQVERHCYWIATRAGVPAGYPRFVNLYLNGLAKGPRHDHETPRRDFVQRRVFDDEDPAVFKLVGGDPFRIWTMDGGVKKQARYRQSWERKKTTVPDDDYTAIYTHVDVLNTAETNLWEARVRATLDVQSWLRAFALNHVVGNWDSYGYELQHNFCAYLSRRHRSQGLLYDMDYSLGVPEGYPSPTNDLFVNSDPITSRLCDHAPFRRMYWALIKEAAAGPMNPAASDALLDAWYAVLLTNQVIVASPAPLKSWIAARYAYITGELARVDAPFEITGSGGSPRWHIYSLFGRAPLEATRLEINGREYAMRFTNGVTEWSLQLGLSNGVNRLTAVAYDRFGGVVGSDTLDVVSTREPPSPVGQVIINEIMYHPRAQLAEFVEIHNRSAFDAFDLSHWRLQGADFTFPGGTILEPGAYQVIARSAPGYVEAYTNAEVLAGEFEGRLANEGENLRLLMPAGSNAWTLVDEVWYGLAPPWPALADGGGPSLQLIAPDADNSRAGSWAVDTNRLYTPGAANSVTAALPPPAELWINELMPTNRTTLADNFGQFDPWVELYNAGSNAVDLAADGYFLTDDLADLDRWAFPAGWTIGAGGYLLVWADGQPAQTAPGFLHAGFALNSVSGQVALVRRYLGRDMIVDYLAYDRIAPDASFGAYPEGDPYRRQVFHYPTPGSANSATSQPVSVRINEWMADNAWTLRDPTSLTWDDWFELYNVSDGPVELRGYHLSDNLSDPTEFTITDSRIIPGKGFMLVWADGDTATNRPGLDLHVSFSLKRSGDQIGLFAPGGELIDAVDFGAQQEDLSEGRWPNGTADIYPMHPATPAASNRVLRIYGLSPTSGPSMLLNWYGQSGRVYRVDTRSTWSTQAWISVGAVTARSDVVTFEDTNAAPRRFYRIGGSIR